MFAIFPTFTDSLGASVSSVPFDEALNPREILHGNLIQTQIKNGSISSRSLALFVFMVSLFYKTKMNLFDLLFIAYGIVCLQFFPTFIDSLGPSVSSVPFDEALNPRVILHGNLIQTQIKKGSISSRSLTLFVFYVLNLFLNTKMSLFVLLFTAYGIVCLQFLQPSLIHWAQE